MCLFFSLSNFSYFLSILPFLLPALARLLNLSIKSMKMAIFPLRINEAKVVSHDSSAEAMRLIILVYHANVIVFMPPLHFNIFQCFLGGLACIKGCCLQFSIPSLYVNFSFCFECFWSLLWNARVLLKYFLDFLKIYFF